ncbi:linear gramicidin synthetase subunit D [Colletotrichum higginsianum]|nr:linear gramicidin synthetase subunit D [Colletotrichum higginsianum]
MLWPGLPDVLATDERKTKKSRGVEWKMSSRWMLPRTLGPRTVSTVSSVVSANMVSRRTMAPWTTPAMGGMVAEMVRKAESRASRLVTSLELSPLLIHLWIAARHDDVSGTSVHHPPAERERESSGEADEPVRLVLLEAYDGVGRPDTCADCRFRCPIDEDEAAAGTACLSLGGRTRERGRSGDGDRRRVEHASLGLSVGPRCPQDVWDRTIKAEERRRGDVGHDVGQRGAGFDAAVRRDAVGNQPGRVLLRAGKVQETPDIGGQLGLDGSTRLERVDMDNVARTAAATVVLFFLQSGLSAEQGEPDTLCGATGGQGRGQRLVGVENHERVSRGDAGDRRQGHELRVEGDQRLSALGHVPGARDRPLPVDLDDRLLRVRQGEDGLARREIGAEDQEQIVGRWEFHGPKHGVVDGHGHGVRAGLGASGDDGGDIRVGVGVGGALLKDEALSPGHDGHGHLARIDLVRQGTPARVVPGVPGLAQPDARHEEAPVGEPQLGLPVPGQGVELVLLLEGAEDVELQHLLGQARRGGVLGPVEVEVAEADVVHLEHNGPPDARGHVGVRVGPRGAVGDPVDAPRLLEDVLEALELLGRHVLEERLVELDEGQHASHDGQAAGRDLLDAGYPRDGLVMGSEEALDTSDDCQLFRVDGQGRGGGGDAHRFPEQLDAVVDGLGQDHGERTQRVVRRNNVDAREAIPAHDVVPPLLVDAGRVGPAVDVAEPPAGQRAEDEAEPQGVVVGDLEEQQVATRPDETAELGHGVVEGPGSVDDEVGDDDVERGLLVALLDNVLLDVEHAEGHLGLVGAEGLAGGAEEAARDIGVGVGREGVVETPEHDLGGAAGAGADLEDAHVRVAVRYVAGHARQVLGVLGHAHGVRVEPVEHVVPDHGLERVHLAPEDGREILADGVHQLQVDAVRVPGDHREDVVPGVRLPLGVDVRERPLRDPVPDVVDPFEEAEVVLRESLAARAGGHLAVDVAHVVVGHALHGVEHVGLEGAPLAVQLQVGPGRRHGLPHDLGEEVQVGGGRWRREGLGAEPLELDQGETAIHREDVDVAADVSRVAAAGVVLLRALGNRRPEGELGAGVHPAEHAKVEPDAVDAGGQMDALQPGVSGEAVRQQDGLDGGVEGGRVHDHHVERGRRLGNPHEARGSPHVALQLGERLERPVVAVAELVDGLVEALLVQVLHLVVRLQVPGQGVLRRLAEEHVEVARRVLDELDRVFALLAEEGEVGRHAAWLAVDGRQGEERLDSRVLLDHQGVADDEIAHLDRPHRLVFAVKELFGRFEGRRDVARAGEHGLSLRMVLHQPRQLGRVEAVAPPDLGGAVVDEPGTKQLVGRDVARQHGLGQPGLEVVCPVVVPRVGRQALDESWTRGRAITTYTGRKGFKGGHVDGFAAQDRPDVAQALGKGLDAVCVSAQTPAVRQLLADDGLDRGAGRPLERRVRPDLDHVVEPLLAAEGVRERLREQDRFGHVLAPVPILHAAVLADFGHVLDVDARDPGARRRLVALRLHFDAAPLQRADVGWNTRQHVVGVVCLVHLQRPVELALGVEDLLDLLDGVEVAGQSHALAGVARADAQPALEGVQLAELLGVLERRAHGHHASRLVRGALGPVRVEAAVVRHADGVPGREVAGRVRGRDLARGVAHDGREDDAGRAEELNHHDLDGGVERLGDEGLVNAGGLGGCEQLVQQRPWGPILLRQRLEALLQLVHDGPRSRRCKDDVGAHPGPLSSLAREDAQDARASVEGLDR